MTSPLPGPTSSPEQLIAALRGGLAAYEELLRRYQPLLTQTARREISPQLEATFGASGVVQETFWKVWQALRDFRGQTEAELVAWMRGILRNVLGGEERKLHAAKRDVRREERVDPGASSASPSGPWFDPNPSPGSQAAQHEQLDRLRQALQRLPDDQRLAVLLQKEHELSDEQIGRLLNCSVEAVRMKRVRGLARLRQELGGDDGA